MINQFRGKYNFLSNFYYAKVTYNGITYLNNEAAFQSVKLLDLTARKKFSNMKPLVAKKEGLKVNLRKDWEKIKITVMYQLVKAKFTQNLALKSQLLDTKDMYLQEGNTWGDEFWGVCNGKGKNMLGKILMKVRKELKEKSNS